jgi:cardiolipin synthase (CMP-forming)
MWLAHLLTLSRLPLAVAFWAVVSRPGPAFVVLALAAGTDLVDGVIARAVMRRRQQAGQPPPSRLGEWLDPLCDKTFVVSALVAVTVHLQPPLWVPLAMATRELILVPLAALYRFTPLLRSRMRYRFRAGALGKAATVVQFLAISALLLRHPLAPMAALLAAAVGLLAALIYIRRGIRLAAGDTTAAA